MGCRGQGVLGHRVHLGMAEELLVKAERQQGQLCQAESTDNADV